MVKVVGKGHGVVSIVCVCNIDIGQMVKVESKGHQVVSMVCACYIDIGKMVKVEGKGHGVVSMVCTCNIYIYIQWSLTYPDTSVPRLTDCTDN